MPDLKFTDTQLMLLTAASQREDHLIRLPETLRGGAVKAVVSRLLALKLVEQVPVGLGQPVWHRAEDDSQAMGLKLTQAGLQAIGLEPDGEAPEDQVSPEPLAALEQTDRISKPVREGSKRAEVIALLSREEGARLDELMAATGWLPHTTRAALTGLRQRGYALTRNHSEGGSIYRIAMPQELGSRANGPTTAEI